MTDQGSTPPPRDPDEPVGPGFGHQGGYGAPPPSGPGYGAPVGPPPPNYLVWAILSTLLCCLPLGIVSIVYAAQVNSKYASGDLAGARESSDKAKKFAIWSAAVGVVLGVLYLVLVLALGAFSTATT